MRKFGVKACGSFLPSGQDQRKQNTKTRRPKGEQRKQRPSPTQGLQDTRRTQTPAWQGWWPKQQKKDQGASLARFEPLWVGARRLRREPRGARSGGRALTPRVPGPSSSNNPSCLLAKARQRGDSNPCGQSPTDFESITSAARSRCPGAEVVKPTSREEPPATFF